MPIVRLKTGRFFMATNSQYEKLVKLFMQEPDKVVRIEGVKPFRVGDIAGFKTEETDGGNA